MPLQSITQQDASWFDSQRTGDLLNRLSSDISVVQKALTVNIAAGLRNSIMVVGGCSMLFYVSPSLAALSLCLIPPVAVAGIYYGRYVQGQQTVVQRALAKTMEIAEESIGNFRVVKHFVQEDAEAQRFDAAVARSYAFSRRIGVVAAYFDGAVHLAANIGLIAVLWHGSNLVATGTLTAGGLTSFLMYSVYTGFNVSGLSTVFTELKRAAGAVLFSAPFRF